MQQKHWVMLTSLVGILVAVMIISDLTTKSVTRSNNKDDKMDQAMEVAEEELGLDGGDSLTGPARALRLAVETQRQALEHQRKLREQINNMNRMNMHEMGVDTANLKTNDDEY